MLDIGRKRKPITREQWDQLPELKWELYNGYIFPTQRERIAVFGLLLQNIGLDEVVRRFGDLDTWRAAIVAREAHAHRQRQ